MRLGSSEKALNFLGYVTVEERRDSHVHSLVKKCLSNRCPQFFLHYFNYNKDVLPRAELFEAGLRQPRVSARFEFRFESLKSISVLILFVYKLMIGSSKNNRENYPRKYF